MGCGTSTLLSDNAAIQEKVRPVLKRRINDIKRRRDLQKGSTPSKKELLSVDDCEKMSSINNDSLGSKSIPSEDRIDHGEAKIVPVVEEEEEATKIVECPLKREEEDEVDDEETEQENIEGHDAELELDEHDDDVGRCISHGSPSFRFYCAEAIPHDIDDDQESHIESPKKKIETETTEEHPVSPDSSAAADDLHKRDYHKRKINTKFRSVIHKGGQVKSLLKVKSCYNPRCSGTHRHDKAHLLQESAA